MKLQSPFKSITCLTLCDLFGTYYLGSSSNDAGEYNMVDAIKLSNFFPSLTFLKVDHLWIEEKELVYLKKPLFNLKKLDIINLWFDNDKNSSCGNEYGWNGRSNLSKLHLLVSPFLLEKLIIRNPIIEEFKQRWMPTLTSEYFHSSLRNPLILHTFENLREFKFKGCLPFDLCESLINNLMNSTPSIKIIWIQELPEDYKKINNQYSLEEYNRIFGKHPNYDLEVKKHKPKNFIWPYPLYIQNENEYLFHSYYKGIPIRTSKFV
jgi:hypothetical protein